MMQLERSERSKIALWSFRLLCAAVFSAAFSLPLGRTWFALSMILLVVDCIRRRRLPAFPPVAWCWLAFFVIAVLASAFGVDPSRSFGKLQKLLWFLVIPLTATLVQTRERGSIVLGSFAAGVGVLALQTVAWRPLSAWMTVRAAVAAGEPGDYLWAITDLGSMTDGQMLMLGILALVGLIASKWRVRAAAGSRRFAAEIGLLVLLVLGLLVNLKRGSWICTLAVVGIFMAARLKLRYLLLLGAVAVSILLLPPVWARFSDLRQEFDSSRGGRIVMWTRIAPPLVKAHPWLGIGYRAMTEAMMQEVARVEGVYVERERDHLHSNPVQVLVATGGLGLGAYVLWMGVGLASGLRHVFREARGSPEWSIALSLVLMLVGLILNGLVEYNLGDSELVVLYAVVLGMVGVGTLGDAEIERSK